MKAARCRLLPILQEVPARIVESRARLIDINGGFDPHCSGARCASRHILDPRAATFTFPERERWLFVPMPFRAPLMANAIIVIDARAGALPGDGINEEVIGLSGPSRSFERGPFWVWIEAG